MRKITLIPLCVDLRMLTGIVAEIIFYIPDIHQTVGTMIIPFEYNATTFDDEAPDFEREEIFKNQLETCITQNISIITPIENYSRVQELIYETLDQVEIIKIDLPVSFSELHGKVYIAIPSTNHYNIKTLAEFIAEVFDYAMKYLGMMNSMQNS